MPLTRISLRHGKSAAYRKALCDGLYRALREALNVPEDDRFILISEHDEVDFDYGANWLGIARSDDLVIFQITVHDTRTVAQKKALYRRLVELLTESPGLRPEEPRANASARTVTGASEAAWNRMTARNIQKPCAGR